MFLILVVFLISIISPVYAKNTISSGDRLFYKSTEMNSLYYDGALSGYRQESEYILEVTYINNVSVGVKEYQGTGIIHYEEPFLKEVSSFFIFQLFHFIDLNNIESVYASFLAVYENNTNVVSVSAADRILYARLEVVNSPIWYGTNYTGSEYIDFIDYGNGTLTIKASYDKNGILSEYFFNNDVIGEYVQQNWTKEIILTDIVSQASMNFIPIVIPLMIYAIISIIQRKRRSEI